MLEMPGFKFYSNWATKIDVWKARIEVFEAGIEVSEAGIDCEESNKLKLYDQSI